MDRKTLRACRRLQLLGALGIVLWLGWIPFGLACILVSSESSSPALRTTSLVALAVYGGAFFATGLAVALWRCPRCGHLFLSWSTAQWSWNRWKACASCGTPFREICGGSVPRRPPRVDQSPGPSR